jgi:hypothetical protein
MNGPQINDTSTTRLTLSHRDSHSIWLLNNISRWLQEGKKILKALEIIILEGVEFLGNVAYGLKDLLIPQR